MNYDQPLQFEWDEIKSQSCLKVRGFDFAYAISSFADPRRIVIPDERFPYGESRYRLLGQIDGRLFVLVYTFRGKSIRIISARKANLRERKEYADHPRENQHKKTRSEAPWSH